MKKKKIKFFKKFRRRQGNKLTEALERQTKPSESKAAGSFSSSEGHRETREFWGFLADISTGLWRLRQKMVQPGADRSLEEMRRAFRDFESVWDTLTQAGIKIQDHTGTAYDPGMLLRVIAFQPTTGLSGEKVIETIKPTVYYKDNSIQIGQVIVGIPKTPDVEDVKQSSNENLKIKN